MLRTIDLSRMPFNTTFEFDDRSWSSQVRRFYLVIARPGNSQNQPVPKNQWALHVSMEASDNKDLISWMLDPSMKKKCSLTIWNDDNSSKFKEIKLDQAYCTRMDDVFLSGTNYMITGIRVSGSKIDIGGTPIQL